MTYDENSPILGTGTLTSDDVVEGSDYWGPTQLVNVMAYLRELHRLCELVGFNFDLLAAQALHETARFSSTIWTTRLNPVGLGVTDGGDDGIAFATGTDAARAHVVHMLAYVEPDDIYVFYDEPWMKNGVDAIDRRFSLVVRQRWSGTIRTLKQLTGRWATDPKYATKIAAKANALVASAQKGAPMTTPPIYDLMRDYARYGISQEDAATIRGYRFENRSGYKPTFIVLHVQAGTTRSSLDWWANGYDQYGRKITASSTVMIQKDGSILQVIPEQHAPWTNGDDRAPTANGLRLVNLPGNSNLHTLSIEAEGMSGADVLADADQLNAIEWQVRDWQARYGIPDANVIRHGDVNSIDRPSCPGAYYAEIMRRITGDEPKPTPEPYPIWWDADDVGPQRRESDGAVAIAFRGEVRVKGDKPINLRQAADPKAPVLRKMAPGERGIIRGTFVSAKKQRWCFVELDGKVYRTLLRYFDPATWPTL